MEELLNKLLKKGWKPFESETQKAREGVYCKKYFFFEGCADGKSIRELTSKESGLWQFCVENKLVNRKRQGTNRLGGEPERCFDYRDYEYRIIESALCDEDKLEKFLLENIKIEG